MVIKSPFKCAALMQARGTGKSFLWQLRNKTKIKSAKLKKLVNKINAVEEKKVLKTKIKSEKIKTPLTPDFISRMVIKSPFKCTALMQARGTG